MSDIVQAPDPVLRKRSRDLDTGEIRDPQTSALIERMKKTLAEAPDGVALAAPQVGISLRIFVVSPKAFEALGKEEELVYINPRILKLSRKKVEMEEGCLSVRNFFGMVKRAERATVEAFNEKGEKFTRGGSGLLAEIFQHEIDHLEGELFIDHVRDLREVVTRPHD